MSLDLQDWFNNYPAVSDLSDDLRPGKPEVRLRLREGAMALGLDATQIAAQLRAAFFGQVVSEVQVGPDAGHSGVNSQRMMEFFIENLVMHPERLMTGGE